MSYAFALALSLLLFLFQSLWTSRVWFEIAPDLLFALVVAFSLLVRSRALFAVLLAPVLLRTAFSTENPYALLAFLFLSASLLQELRFTVFPQRAEIQFALAFLLANAYFILRDSMTGGASPWWGGIGSGILTALAVPVLFWGIRFSRIFRPLLEPSS